MCSIDTARETLIAQICVAEELLRSLPGSSSSKCFIDLTDEVGSGVVVVMRLTDCRQSGMPRICINSHDVADASEIDSESQPFASMAIAQLGMRSLIMLGRHIPALIEAAKAAESDVVEAAEHLAAAIATAVASPQCVPTWMPKASLRPGDGSTAGIGSSAVSCR